MKKFKKKATALLKIKNVKWVLIFVVVIFLFVFSVELMRMRHVVRVNPFGWMPVGERQTVNLDIDLNSPPETALSIQENDKSVYCSLANGCPSDKCVETSYCYEWDNSNPDLSKCTKKAPRCSLSYSQAVGCVNSYLKRYPARYPLFKYTKVVDIDPDISSQPTCAILGIDRISEDDLMCWSVPVTFKGLEGTNFPYDRTNLAVGNKTCNVYFTDDSKNIFAIKDMKFRAAEVTVSRDEAWKCAQDFVTENGYLYEGYKDFGMDKLEISDLPREYRYADTSDDLLYYFVSNKKGYLLPADITLIVGAHTCEVHSLHP